MLKNVFVNGTFDIIHIGHLRLLNYARSLGDVLHVAIDSDRRVTELKGPTRPINCAEERKELLINLKSVDFVHVFYTNAELEELIKNIAPDIMIVGSDWRGKRVIGSQFAKQVNFFERIDEYSTTKKIQYIVNR